MVLGFLLDRGVGTTPLFTLVGLLIGIVAAARLAYTNIRKIFGSGHE
jgi:F0F1-type ATP synthase assembly protein I